MYDKFESERQLVNIPQFEFSSNRYEVWSGGRMISSDMTHTIISFECMSVETPSEDAIKISLSTSLSINILDRTLYFDVAYTNNDRILLAIIPQSSNCQGDNSFDSFINFAPFFTRNSKNFKNNEPHACSLFLVNGTPEKITFSIASSKVLIEFYI